MCQIPTGRDYDQLQILERAGFENDPEPVNQLIDKPKSFANAQIMLRFGDRDRKCGCQSSCQCFQTIPFVFPYILPSPCAHRKHRHHRNKGNTQHDIKTLPIIDINIGNNYQKNEHSIIDDIPDIINLDSINHNNNNAHDVTLITDNQNPVVDIITNYDNSDSLQTNVEKNVNINTAGFQVNKQLSDLSNVDYDGNSNDNGMQSNTDQNLNINTAGVQINNQQTILSNEDRDNSYDSNDDGTDSESDGSNQSNTDQNLNINTDGLQINSQQPNLSNNDSYNDDDDGTDSKSDDSKQSNSDQNLNINTGGIQINNQRANLSNNDDDDDNNNNDDNDDDTNNNNEDTFQQNTDRNFNVNTGGLQINNQQANLSNNNNDFDNDDNDDDDDDDNSQRNIDKNFNINTGGVQINNQDADLSNVNMDNDDNFNNDNNNDNLFLLNIDNDGDINNFRIHNNNQNDDISKKTSDILSDVLNINKIADLTDNQYHHNVADLFEPENPDNPIVITFEKAGAKLLDLVAQKLNPSNNDADNDELNLVNLFHPENPKNPILQTFEKASSTFFQNIMNKLNPLSQHKLKNSIINKIEDLGVNLIEDSIKKKLINQYYSNIFNFEKQNTFAPQYNPNAISYPIYQSIPGIQILNPGLLTQNSRAPGGLNNLWSSSQWPTAQFERPLECISGIRIKGQAIDLISQGFPQSLSSTQIITPNGQIIIPKSLINIIDSSTQEDRMQPSAHIGNCQCVLSKL